MVRLTFVNNIYQFFINTNFNSFLLSFSHSHTLSPSLSHSHSHSFSLTLGIMLHGHALKVRRPKDYIPAPAIDLGGKPSLPAGAIVATNVPDSPYKASYSIFFN